MLMTILNMFALFIAIFAVITFAVFFVFFLFIMYACIYIGWKEISGVPISDILRKLKDK